MTDTPAPAVLVEVNGVERWCTREVSRYGFDGRKTYPTAIHAYTDVMTGIRFAPAKCREIREGLVRVAVEEVKA